MINKNIEIIEILKKVYPHATCSLDFKNPFELVVAVILSAQCTDERVNKTTPYIFSKYSSPEDFSKIDLKLLEDLIHPCGFYKNKAKNIKNAAKRIVDVYDGIVPNTMEELLTLPGIGRKSANVIMLEVFANPVGIAVDTHAKRISNRLEFSKNADPEKIEQDLLKIFPKKYLKDINHLLVFFGRDLCVAKSPKCDICPLKKYCNFYKTV